MKTLTLILRQKTKQIKSITQKPILHAYSIQNHENLRCLIYIMAQNVLMHFQSHCHNSSLFASTEDLSRMKRDLYTQRCDLIIFLHSVCLMLAMATSFAFHIHEVCNFVLLHHLLCKVQQHFLCIHPIRITAFVLQNNPKSSGQQQLLRIRHQVPKGTGKNNSKTHKSCNSFALLKLHTVT